MSRNHPEDDLQEAVASFLDRCLSPDVFWCHVPNGGKRNAREAARLKRMGVKAGVFDLMLIWQGRIYMIELKAGRNGLSPAQEQFSEILVRQCIAHDVARSLDEVIGLLGKWKIPTIGRIAA